MLLTAVKASVVSKMVEIGTGLA